MTGPPVGSTAPRPDPPPVTELGDVLLISLRGDLHDGAAEQLQRDVIHRVAHSPAPVAAVVIGVSGVETAGTFLCRALTGIADGARRPATRTVPAGMRPAAAVTPVEPGLTPPGPATAPDIDRALSPVGEAPPATPPVHPEGGA